MEFISIQGEITFITELWIISLPVEINGDTSLPKMIYIRAYCIYTNTLMYLSLHWHHRHYRHLRHYTKPEKCHRPIMFLQSWNDHCSADLLGQTLPPPEVPTSTTAPGSSLVYESSSVALRWKCGVAFLPSMAASTQYPQRGQTCTSSLFENTKP